MATPVPAVLVLIPAVISKYITGESSPVFFWHTYTHTGIMEKETRRWICFES